MTLHDIFRGDVIPLSGIAVSIGRNTYDPPAPVVPVYDIHTREIDLYDSGSGIIRYHNRITFNPSNSGMTTIVTAVCTSAYNSANQALGSLFTDGTVIEIDTYHVNSEDYFADDGGGVFTVFTSGIYEITARSSCTYSVGTTRFTIRCWLERSSNGGAFAEMPGSRHWLYCRNDTNGEDTSLCTIILDNVAPGDRFRLKMSQEDNSDPPFAGPQSQAGGCGLVFEKLR